MNERSIFLHALEKEDPTERSAFLEKACGQDTNLRQRVELLLQSHTDAGSFLDIPAPQQACEQAAQAAQAATPDGLDQTQTLTSVQSAAEVSLEFLTPARRPGSLGRIGHYEVLEVVGRGGFGIVLRAFDEKLHRVVAVKVLSNELASSGSAKKRFKREARAAAAVTHDNVVAIHAVEEGDPRPYLVMQFVDGRSLQQKIAAEGSLDLKAILRIGSQIAAGLAAAHKQGHVHRDIKPANILLENGVERVKITDFGLARAVDDASLTHSGVIAGTPQYMSPEQADGKPVDHRSDLFSLGSVMYAMCTGRTPFRAESTMATLRRVCDDTPRPIRELNPDIPEWLCEIITKLHAKSPAERYQTAKEVAGLLEDRLADVQKGITPPPLYTPVMAMLEEHLAQMQKGIVASPTASASESATPPAPALRDIPASLALKVALGLLTVGGIVQVVLLAGWITRGSIFGWAAGASAVAMGFLALFFLYHLVIHLRAKHRARVAAGLPSASRWPRLVGYGVLILLGLVAIAMWGNGIDKAKWFFQHELVVQLPDTDTVVQFWETKDEVERENAWNFSGAWPMEPRATIANTKEKRLRLPPANYWMFVTKDGKSVERRLLKIGWGGKQVVRIGSGHSAALAVNDSKGAWVQLFNGKDLAGWVPQPHDERNWHVEDGILIGNGNRSYLISKRDDYRNFHLRAEVKINSGGGDSGLYFRCRPDESLPRGIRSGYEAQIISPAPGTSRTGSLFQFVNGKTHDLKLVDLNLIQGDTWFSLEVIADGKRIIVKVDDKVTAEYVDEQPIGERNHVVLDTYTVGTRVQFRKIEIKELPADDRLEGAWRTVSGERGGVPWPAHEVEKFRMSFTGSTMRSVIDTIRSETTFRVESGQDPRGIHIAKSPTHAAMHGIYRIQRDELTLCIRPVEAPPPTAFDSKIGTDVRLIVLKRDVASEAGWVQLFNGKDLSGWDRDPARAGDWRVENEALVGTGKGTDLWSKWKLARNFHFRAEMKLDNSAEGAVVFRCHPDLPPLDKEKLSWLEAALKRIDPNTVQAGIVLMRPDGGHISPAAKVSMVPADQWFTLEVTLRDNEVVLKVNGESKLDSGRFLVPHEVVREGSLTLRTGVAGRTSPARAIQFRKIELKELPASADAADHAKLQGKWRLIAGERMGKPLSVVELKEVDWILFSGDNLLTNYKGTISHGTFKLNVASQPKELNSVTSENDPMYYIYRFDGERLTIALSHLGGARPKDFTTAPDSVNGVYIFQREAESGVAADSGVLIFRFEPGEYSEKILKFGAVVQLQGSDPKKPSREVLKPYQQVATTYRPGEYSLEVSESTELELSRTRVILEPKGEEVVLLRPRRPLDDRWVAVSAEYQGKQVPLEESKDTYPSEMLIKGDQYGITWAGKQYEGGLHLDTTKAPAEIDFTGSVFAGLKPRKAIYELDGDRLKLCMAFVGPNADPPRPTSFKTDPQSKNVVLTYRREGPAPLPKRDAEGKKP